MKSVADLFVQIEYNKKVVLKYLSTNNAPSARKPGKLLFQRCFIRDTNKTLATQKNADFTAYILE